MIEFATVFLGLITGVQAIELSVLAPVAFVEIRLDDNAVGFIEQPPWRMEIDLGPELRPRRLEAIAYDAERTEVGRAEQILNLPRARADLRIVVGRSAPGQTLQGRLMWTSVEDSRPLAVSVTADGEPIEVDGGRSFELAPAADPERGRVVSASVDFDDGETAHATVLIGGAFGERVTSQLTAVPVQLESGADLPGVAGLAGWLRAGREPLEVMAVEHRHALLIAVRDRTTWGDLRLLSRRFRTRAEQQVGGLGGRRSVRLLDAVPEARTGGGASRQLFPMSQRFSEGDGGLPTILGTYFREEETSRRRQVRDQRVPDAVATAAMSAARSRGPRAVLLVLGDSPHDEGQWPPAVVRRYLRSLRVPFHIWTPIEDPEARRSLVEGRSAWGPAEDISDPSRLLAAIGRLSRDLDGQRILWVKGEHLLDRIELSPKASGIRLID